MNTRILVDLYLRLSDGRRENGTFASREAVLRRKASELGWQVHRVVTENDEMSGKTSGSASAFKRRKITLPDGSAALRVVRPGFRSILDDLATGRVKAILAEDLDRVVRDPRDGEDLLDIIERVKGYADSLSDSLRLTAGGTDAEVYAFRGNVNAANKASKDTARRVRLGRERKAFNGENGGGRRPYGFLRDGITVDETEAKEIRDMADQVLKNVSLAHVALSLNTRAVPTVTGAPWTAPLVKDVLSKPRCAGILVYKGEEASRLAGDSILDEDTWKAVTDAMNSEFITWIDPNGGERKARRRNSVGTTPRWLGTGIYLCVCGATMEIQRGGSSTPIYRCSVSNKPKGSVHVKRNAAAVDDLVTSRLIARMAMPDAAAALIPASPEVDVKALRHEAAVLRVQLGEWDTDRTEGRVTRTRWLTQTETINRKLDAIEQQLNTATVASPLAPLANAENMERIAEIWESMPLGTQRAAINVAMIVTIRPTRRRPGFDETAVTITGIDGTPWPA